MGLTAHARGLLPRQNAVMVNMSLRTGALLLALPLALAACSSSADRSAAPAGDPSTAPTPVSASSASSDSSAPAQGMTSGLTGSTATYIEVENRLKLADGTPIPITWKVSDTENKYWDGNGRPDHAPPAGLQGLVQNPTDDPYRVRLEVNSNYVSGQAFFTLTPVARIQNMDIPLAPMNFGSNLLYVCEKRRRSGDCDSGYSVPLWQAGAKATTGWTLACYSQPRATFTAQTPRGLLTYGFQGRCSTDDQPSSFTITTVD